MDKSLEMRTWMKVDTGPLRDTLALSNFTRDVVTVTELVN